MPRDIWQECSKDRARFHDRRRQMSRQFQALHQAGCPRALHWIDHLSGRRVRKFADRISSQPVVNQIWNSEQVFRGFKKLSESYVVRRKVDREC